MISLRSVLWPLLGASLVLAASAASSQAQTAPRRPAATPKAAASPSPAAVDTLPDVVATVDGESIRKEELQRIAMIITRSAGQNLSDLKPSDRLAAYTSALDSIIDDKLVSKEAASETVSDIDVEKGYGQLVSQYPNPQAFDDQVKKAGETTEKIRQNIHNQIAQQQWLQQQIADQIKVTPEEVEKFYKEGPPSKFDEPETVHAAQILVAVPRDAPPEDALRAEQASQAMADRLKKGESFEEEAKRPADDANLKKTTADLGYFDRKRIMPEFIDAAFKLKVGEVSAPIRTQFGYHLIKVLDHKAAHTATFDEAKDQIAEFLQTEKRQQAVAQLLAGLRAKAKIVTFLPATKAS